jgi:hypothetical protein
MNKYIQPILLLTGLLIAVSCGILGKNGRKNKMKVAGTMSVESPVCDKSSAEKPGIVPMANTTYYIKNGKTNHPDSIAFDQLDTDDNGQFEIYLHPGYYAIVHRDKLMNFGEFRLKYSSNKSTYYKVRDDDCFRRWYNSADFLLHVTADTTVQLTAKSRCFIQTNPCLEYTGPR